MTFTHSETDLRGESVFSITLTTTATKLSEVMQEFRLFLLAASYSPELVNQYIEAE